MAAGKLKIGVAGMRRGLGFGRLFAKRKDCEVTVVCDVNRERAVESARELSCKAVTDYDELCGQDIHAVAIVTPVPVHYDCTMKALEAGKHVLCEIPAVSSAAEAEGLIRKVKETGLVYMAAENVCYFPCIQKMHSLVRDGKIGRVTYAEGEYVHDCRGLLLDVDDGLGGGINGRPSWRAGFDHIRYSTHELGPLLMILDDFVVSAAGMETTDEGKNLYEKINVQTALFKTAGGRLIRELTSFYITREPSHHFYSLYGTEGSIETDRYKWTENLKMYIKGSSEKKLVDVPTSLIHENVPAEYAAGGHGTSEHFMIEEFVMSVLEGRQPFLDVYRALEMTMPGICAAESIRNGGRSVPVLNYRVLYP